MIEMLSDATILIDFINTILRLSMPLVFAALGGVMSERCGVFNISLEGMILAGAFSAAVGSFFFGSSVAGLFAGILSGALIGLILAYLCVSLRVNQIVAGLAINIFIMGLTASLSRIVFDTQGTMTVLGFRPIAVPLFFSIPIVGPILFNQDVLVYLMYVLVPSLYIIIFYTRWGLNIRAVGEYPEAADSAGISPNVIRYFCILSSGALASMGGCYLALSHVFMFSTNMSAGKGFIALAAIVLGRWNPVGVLIASLLFGTCDAIQLRLQFAHPNAPYQIFVALPFVVAILALIGVIGATTPPGSVGIPYKRGKSGGRQTVVSLVE